MTNQEYLTTTLGKFGVSDNEIQIILLESGINGSTEVTPADMPALKRALYTQMPLMLAGVQDISEGGYSVKWNLDAIKLWYSALASELGLPDVLVPKPTISSPKVW